MLPFSIARRRSVVALSLLAGSALMGVARITTAQETMATLLDASAMDVLPPKGFQSKVSLGASVVKLVQYGVIVPAKLRTIQQRANEVPAELQDVLTVPSNSPMMLTKPGASAYVNLLWPLGLANYMRSNEQSPINGKSLFTFASTGGWNLGVEQNGGAYFNRFKIIELTPEQEARVMKIANSSYRPCCDNSTFFQDCNHGSAMLGLLQLGAAQGLTEKELWHEALAFNSFWFEANYIETGYYFKAVQNTEWEKVDPALVMGKQYSSSSGWATNVDGELRRRNFLPNRQNGASCGL